MITKENFKDMLKSLGFRAKGEVWTKSIDDADLAADFRAEKLIYPEKNGLKVNNRKTCNFSDNENFVVFECIHRLLKKGYKPEHLEIEPKWKIGHGASGGRADILVRDQQNKEMLLIECKTAGREFSKEWKQMLADGGQLFGYTQQISQTRYLCLYASDFSESEKISVNYKLISHTDNPQMAEGSKASATFAKANSRETRFAVWRDIYQLEFSERGVFEKDVPAYTIGKSKYTLAADTKDIGVADKKGKYHEFRTILRKHNIARRENAFEVLVNLFLCKIVDEEENKTDLKFCWKGVASDNYYDFVDRLQNLYQRGMDLFLHEEISYISNENIDSAFWTVKNKRNATKKEIQKYFRELKFFTNSAFSFVNTHNEELFNKNARVLLEVVQMWEGMRLKSEKQNQFLGDMFEYFLDNSIKQSNGQFFTPLPICKFIVSSLPLAEKVAATREPLKVIDYACGAGHFLTEYAHQIEPLVEAEKRDIKNYYANIVGVEKEDRLAKVAKIAAHMYGQEQIKILDADALAAHAEIAPESFDVLAANPPFSVEGFLQTLGDEDKNNYELTQVAGKDSGTNTIQCFFMERVRHLMAPDGVVGVIVPNTILSNDDSVHNGAREILLKYFDFVAIAELGSAFGKTGTETVVLFLRRKAQKPEAEEHYANRVEDFFEGDEEGAEYRDHHLIRTYCEHVGVLYEEYVKLFAQTSVKPLAELLQCKIFREYVRDFEKSAETQRFKGSNAFKRMSASEQKAKAERRLIGYLHAAEKVKLFYFILAHEQAGKVLVVNAPKSTDEHKRFLGYTWSSAKGQEGIKYIGGETVNDIITPLFDPENLDNAGKINTAIKNNFNGKSGENLPEYCRYVNLTSMLDFGRVNFDKVININVPHNEDVATKYELVELGEYVNFLPKSKRAASEGKNKGKYPFFTSSSAQNKYIDYADYTARAVIVGDGGKSGVHVADKFSASDHNFIMTAKQGLLSDYLYFYLLVNFDILTRGLKGTTLPNISKAYMRNIKFPLPPLDAQRRIVAECEREGGESVKARQIIDATKRQINDKILAVMSARYQMKKLQDIAENMTAGGDKPKGNFSETKTEKLNIPVYANSAENKGLLGYTDMAKITKPCITISARGTLGYTEVRNENFCPVIRLIVLIPKTNQVDLFYLKHIVSATKFANSGAVIPQLTVPKVGNVKIPVPPLKMQKKLAAEIEKLEKKIAEAQAIIDGAAARKKDILDRYLL